MPSLTPTCKRLPLAWIAVWLVACSQPGQVSGVDEAATRRMVIEQLSTKLDSSVVRPPLDTSRIQWWNDESSVVPNLSYHWAWYHAPEISHGLVSAVVAVRTNNLRPVRTTDDWSRVAQGWFPENADQAREACAEVARVVGQKQNLGRLAIPLGQAGPEIAAMPPQLRQRVLSAQADSPIVESPSATNRSWKVTQWMFETGQTTRYRCTFGESGIGSTRLDTLSIIREVGWPDLLRHTSADSG